MAEVFFDLSELFLSSGVKFKYYGIARTVMEVAYELHQIAPDTRYVVYSPRHRRFFEVFPRVGSASPTGVLDPNLPTSAIPMRLRQSLYDNNLAKKAGHWIASKFVDWRNERRWRTIPVGAVKPIDLNGNTLLSLGRPKIMSDYLTALGSEAEKTRFIPLLHDLIPLHDFEGRADFAPPQNFIHDNSVVIKAASLVLTNSRFTASEVQRFSDSGVLPPAPKIVPVPLCAELRPTDEAVTKKGPKAPYLLCVGIYNGRKNLECVTGALLELALRGVEAPDLVLAGARRKNVDEFLARPELNPIRSKIHHVVDPNQAELAELYRGAFATVLPSRMEGWGLPVSESLWLGTPALAADVPALREAGGDLALYFDPEKPQELAGLIERLEMDALAYSTLRAQISASYSEMRTWRDVATDIRQIVSEV